MIGAGRTDRTFKSSGHRYGDGDTDTIGAGAYALWMHNDGWYVDGVLKYDRYKNTLNARGVDGFVSKGSHTNEIIGLSVEAGRRVYLAPKTHAPGRLWAEPSVQAAVAWIEGSDYTVSNGVSRELNVRISDSTALQYRGQLRAGADIGSLRPYIKFGVLKSDTRGGAVHVEGRRYQPWFDGWRFETGAGLGYLIDEKSQVYLDYEYNKANRYERPWSLTLGYRRAW